MNTAKDDESKTYTAKELRADADKLRVFLKETDAFAEQMDGDKITEITVKSGAKAYKRAALELNRWSTGVRAGLHAAMGIIENGDAPPAKPEKKQKGK